MLLVQSDILMRFSLNPCIRISGYTGLCGTVWICHGGPTYHNLDQAWYTRSCIGVPLYRALDTPPRSSRCSFKHLVQCSPILHITVILTLPFLAATQNASAASYWSGIEADVLMYKTGEFSDAAHLYSMLPPGDSTTFVGALTNGWVTSSVIFKTGTTSTTMAVPGCVSDQFMSLVDNNSSLILPYMLYSLIANPIPEIAQSPAHTIIGTTLNDTEFVNLENGNAQVLVLTQDAAGTAHVLNQPTDVTWSSQGSFNVDDITCSWAATTELLVIPANLSTTASSAAFGAFAASANAAGVLNMFESQHGITIFVPQDSSVNNPSVSSMDAAELGLLWQAHAVNGTNYSPGLASKQFTAFSGLQLTVSIDGTTVTAVGGNSAHILTSDIIIWNGVVHMIDNLLINPSAAALAPDINGASRLLECTTWFLGTDTS
ncbi:FAS1 domain-containing protein [Gyrodon lividus]|nr:FAS1 domain-containing protein [Gyrodon lividus]